MTWITLGRELKALDAMNNLDLWMTCSTLGHDFRPLDAMNSLELLIICTTQDPMILDLLILWTT